MNASSLEKRILRPIALVAMSAALAACATGPRSIRTEVTSFNEWSSLPADKTYTFARTLQYRSSLEVKSYEDQVGGELATQGFRLVSDGAQASLVVTLRPSVSSTSVFVPDRWFDDDPFWGGPYGGFYGRGFYGRGFYGPGFYGSGFGGLYSASWYDDRVGSERLDVFHKSLELDIDAQGAGGRRFYEGKVETSSRNSSLPQVMPVLIHALFTDFPGNNGQTRRVDVPVQRAPS